jgi:hypothetical protein
LLNNQISEKQDLFTRKNFKWHITASAYIISPNKEKFLVIHNRKLDKWLVPWWHTEKVDGEIYESAEREANEESWLYNLKLLWRHKENNFIPIDIDTHIIPHNPKKDEAEHFHHDFSYIFLQEKSDDVKIQKEEIKWYKWLLLNDDLELFAGKEILEKIKKVIL